MKRIETKYVIIRAGCSGLGFATGLNSEEYIIVEKENSPGGYCRTIKEDGFIWDYAGHFFHFATSHWKEYFEKHISPKELVSVKKNTKIYYKGRLIDYPFQKNIHQLEKEEFIECLYDLYFRKSKKCYSSFKEMLRGKFGDSICKKFLIPYNEKLYACNLDNLDSDAMGRFFPNAELGDIISNMKEKNNKSYNDYFLYPKEGAEVFVNALLSEVDEKRVLLGEKVISVNKDEHVVKTEHYEIAYEKLINTSPLSQFIQIMDKKIEQTDLKCNKVLVFNLGFNKKSLAYKGIHWVYIPDKTINFYRIGFYDNILNQDCLSMYVEIGYNQNEEIDIDNQLKLTLVNLKKIGVISDHILLNHWHCIMDPAYVYISEKSNRVVEQLMSEWKKDDIYSIGRYGGWKYCSIEDCLVEAEELRKIIII